MAAAHKFDMVLAVSDDRTHEDLPSAWREGPSAALPALAQLAHGVFAVSSAGPAARTRAKYFVEDTSEVIKLQGRGASPEVCARPARTEGPRSARVTFLCGGNARQVLMVLKALAEVSERAAQSGGGLDRAPSATWSSSSRLSGSGSAGTL
jgi:hypothetical protein